MFGMGKNAAVHDVAWLTAESKLRDIQAITDAELSRLDAEDLLVKLLERVKVIMNADTAAVLLIDRSGTQLVATAASGLEEEVRQGARVPVGQGFAGRVAAEARPVILDHVDSSNVVNPILLAKGIRALIGVPLLADGTPIGVLHVGSLSTRKFTSDDAELLQLAADGLEIAARYVPRDGSVGGDWYDVFFLPSGELCAVMGDVAGAGLHAAIMMGRMRSALRAYALETRDPAEVLRRLDRKMLHFEPDIIATVLYAVFDRDLEHVRISSAGHVPPVVAAPGQAGALADMTNDPLIGLSAAVPRHSATIPLEPGSLLCLYTDGLVEHPGKVIDEGLAELCRVITPGPADLVCATAMGLLGSSPHSDDTTILVFHRLAR
jgi:phosphoserine phosphatase RsbU/P